MFYADNAVALCAAIGSAITLGGSDLTAYELL